MIGSEIRKKSWMFVAWMFFLAASANAHTPSESHLLLTTDESGAHGRWDIAVRDLDHALGIDLNGDRQVTWHELQAAHPAIAQYALDSLRMTVDGNDCVWLVGEQQVAKRGDESFSTLLIDANCSVADSSVLEIDYRLFRGVDATHRAILQLTSAGQQQVAVLDNNATARTFSLADQNLNKDRVAPGFVAVLSEFFVQGVWHIWIGIDHILFLVALMLPAFLARRPIRNLLIVVTSFTLAHSITLALAALELVLLPVVLVESAIAATVIFTAFLNIKRPVPSLRWPLAFGFGLLHGFGFAAALSHLELPREHLVSGLFGFNLGVEIGQLAILFVVAPLAIIIAKSSADFYRAFLLRTGSFVIGVIGIAWFADRVFDLGFMPF